MSGRVLTFYSFKGGVGRSMALANVAVVLAGRGRRVLCVDWDLEAAGLHAYFRPCLPEGWVPERGLLDLVEDAEIDWKELVTRADLGDVSGHVDLLPAGSGSGTYVERLQNLDWSKAYAEHGLGDRLEALRTAWTQHYDVVLLDSRTGLSDIGGICTIQMPDILVMLFSANRQSLDGTLDVARRAIAAREDLPVTRRALMVLPIPSRFEGRTEVEQAQRWLDIFAEELQPLYRNWLDKNVTPREILRYTRIPAVPRWSFDESLPVLVEDRSDPDTISYALEGIAALLDRGLGDTGGLVKERGDFVREQGRKDFGFFVPDKGCELALDVNEALERRGRRIVWFGDHQVPGHTYDEAIDAFVGDVRVVVMFCATLKTDGEALVALCRRRGRRFVPVLVTTRSRLAGAEQIIPIKAGTSPEECARLLERVLALPPLEPEELL